LFTGRVFARPTHLAAAAAVAVAVLLGSASAASADPVIAAAGDIACDTASGSFNGGNGTASQCRHKATSDLLLGSNLASVLTLGDNQYEDGAYDQYLRSFDPTWGRVKPLIDPVPGNHEYHSSQAAGYFRYFGAAAGDPATGYYSYEIGAWHLVALNSNCGAVRGCDTGSPQERWLRDDLATHTNQCVLAYWHHPRYSSGEHGDTPAVQGLWSALADARADVVLSGHDHSYERFAPMGAAGRADAAGVRQFVVGTGGKSHYPFRTTHLNSEVRNADTYGVLELILHPTGYDWRFVPESGKAFTDAGSAACS
jgi:calcineurin-like phosphoesterase family protein